MPSVGIDLIEIARMKIDDKFYQRFLTDDEIILLKNKTTIESKKRFLANRWALKEALYKALPQEHLIFDQINIYENKYGQPTVDFGKYIIALSLTHTETLVTAIAVVF